MKKLYLSRREFVAAGVLGAGGLLFYGLLRGDSPHPPLRPPGVLDEEDFNGACLRCQECVRACLTQCLEPAGGEFGAGKLWTPRFNPDLAKCEFALCGRACAQACPAGLLQPIPDEDVRLGLAALNRKRCIVWSEGKDCLICYERCRYQAIEVDLERRPHLVGENCVGCGACQNSCIARPQKAIVVYPLGYSVPESGDGKRKRGN